MIVDIENQNIKKNESEDEWVKYFSQFSWNIYQNEFRKMEECKEQLLLVNKLGKN